MHICTPVWQQQAIQTLAVESRYFATGVYMSLQWMSLNFDTAKKAFNCEQTQGKSKGKRWKIFSEWIFWIQVVHSTKWPFWNQLIFFLSSRIMKLCLNTWNISLLLWLKPYLEQVAESIVLCWQKQCSLLQCRLLLLIAVTQSWPMLP